MNLTPEIHSSEISAQKYIGLVEIDDSELHVVRIIHPSGSYLVAGGGCNTGMLPSYARLWDETYENFDEALQEFIADIEEAERKGSPSDSLLSWHGSLVI